MVRLSLLVVLVLCLMGQMECNNRARGRDRQNRMNETYKPMLNELTEIKVILDEIKEQANQNLVNLMYKLMLNELTEIEVILKEIKEQGSVAATTQLNQTQPEEIQVAECPECQVYETCNQTTYECEKRCQPDEKIRIDDANITSDYTTMIADIETYYVTINWQESTTDGYIQFHFSDMKIVGAFTKVEYAPVCMFSNYTIETSEDCENFTQTLPSVEEQQCPGENIVLQEPIFAQCVRVYPILLDESFAAWWFRIQIYGCSA